MAAHPDMDVPLFDGPHTMPKIKKVKEIPYRIGDVERIAIEWGKLGNEAKEVLSKQFSRVVQAAQKFQTYNPNPNSKLAYEGIVSRNMPLIDYASFLKDEIIALAEMGVPDPLPIREIDRSVDVTKKMIDDVAYILDECGLDRVANEYFGWPMKIRTVNLHLSRPGDQHHYQTYRDMGHFTKLLNLHVDPKPGVLKVIIYLSHVGPENGPFQFMRGSNNWLYDDVERCFAWGNSVGNYCHNRLYRKVMGCIPPKFRKTAIIGKLIQDGTPESDYFLSHLTSYTSNLANVMLFDPVAGFHRGGLVKEGERLNLQVVLSPCL